MSLSQPEKHLFTAGFILGLGLLGALDGIIFHQLLDWHHVLDHHSSRVELISDGVFHLGVTLLMLWGAVRIFAHAREDRLSHNWPLFWGSLLFGGGVFNLVEGIINHHLLQIHHVKPGDPNELWFDIGFLLSGVLLGAIGWALCSAATGKSNKSHAA